MRRAPLLLFVAAALHAGRAGAPPPLSPFPSALRPADGTTAPPNARVWAFGADAPALPQIGVAVSTSAGAVDVVTAVRGCCVVVASPSAPLPAGAVVSVLVTSPGNEASAAFTVSGVDDVVPPTLAAPVVLDAAGGTLTLGVAGDDDVGLAGFLAKHGDVVVSAATPDVVLQAAPDDEGCVDVTAIDLAGNESAPQRACAPDDDVDGGPAPAPAPWCAGNSAVDAPHHRAAPASLVVLVLLLARRRRAPRVPPERP